MGVAAREVDLAERGVMAGPVVAMEGKAEAAAGLEAWRVGAGSTPSRSRGTCYRDHSRYRRRLSEGSQPRRRCTVALHAQSIRAALDTTSTRHHHASLGPVVEVLCPLSTTSYRLRIRRRPTRGISPRPVSPKNDCHNRCNHLQGRIFCFRSPAHHLRIFRLQLPTFSFDRLISCTCRRICIPTCST